MNTFDGWIRVNVLRADGVDCSMNGITVDGSKLYVKVQRGNYTEEELLEYRKEGQKIVFLEEIPPAFQGCPVRFRDRDMDYSKHHVSFGGNFVYTSDSRFSKKYPYPISVHDRIEY